VDMNDTSVTITDSRKKKHSLCSYVCHFAYMSRAVRLIGFPVICLCLCPAGESRLKKQCCLLCGSSNLLPVVRGSKRTKCYTKNSSVAKALYTDLCMMRWCLVFDRILSHKYMKCVLIMSSLAIKGRKHISFARILNVGYCLDEPANSLNKHPRDVCPANGEN